MLQHYVSKVVAYPKAVIAAVSVITVALVAALVVLRIPFLIDLDAQIPPNHPMVLVSKRAEKLFGGKYTTIVGVYMKDGAEGTIYTPDILGRIDRITKELEQFPGVKPGSVLSLTAKQIKDVDLSDGGAPKPLFTTMPQSDKELEEFKARVKRNSTFTDLLVSADGRSTAVFMDFEDFSQAGQPHQVFEKIDAIIEKERDDAAGQFEIVPAGSPPVMYWLRIYTMRVAVLLLVALAMIGYLHYRAFRTIQGMIVPLVTAVMGVLWALGLMAIIRAPMDPWNVMTPVLLLAIGAGHSVQILKRYYEEYNRVRAAHPEQTPQQHNADAVVGATVKVGRVMLAAGTIASLSFFSLYLFDIPSIQSFGLCTGFGIVAALVVEMTFIPAIRVLMKPPSAKETEQEQSPEFFDVWLERFADVVRQKKEGPVLWVFLGIILVAGVGATRLDVGNSLGEQFFEGNGPVHGFRMADSRLSGTRVIQVLIEGDKPGTLKDPVVLAKMEKLTETIKAQPLPVGKVVSFVDVMKQLAAFAMEDPNAPLPDSPEQVAQIWELFQPADNEISRMVDTKSDFQNGVITAYIKTDDFRQMKQMTVNVQAEADRLFEGTSVKATVGGGVTNAIALNETMVKAKTNNLLQICGLVVLITAILMRSLVAGFLVLLPLATSALVNLGLMGWTGILLSMGTAAISAMAIGIGADYAVYFLFRVREEFQRCGDLREATASALLTSGKAIAYVATAVAGGYLCLALSMFKVHVLLGVLVSLTMITSSVATVVFLPAMVLRFSPKFLGGKRAETPGTPVVSS